MSNEPAVHSPAPLASAPATMDSRARCAPAQGSAEWWREKYWDAHRHSQEMFREVARLLTALQAIADEACRHHEHNPISGKDRLPIGYTKILNIADAALNPPNGRDEPRGANAKNL